MVKIKVNFLYMYKNFKKNLKCYYKDINFKVSLMEENVDFFMSLS